MSSGNYQYKQGVDQGGAAQNGYYRADQQHYNRGENPQVQRGGFNNMFNNKLPGGGFKDNDPYGRLMADV